MPIARIIREVLVAVVLLLGLPPAWAGVGNYSVTRDLTYTPSGWPQAQLADVYRPEGEGPFPSVLLIHGGGWKTGDREQMESQAERIARHGYLVVNITYRLLPDYHWPAQLQDVQQAVRWMRSAAGLAQGVDPERIASFGYSAGGHLAALLGAIPADSPHGDAQARVRAVVAGGAPASLVSKDPGIAEFIGAPMADGLAPYEAASPIYYAKAGHAPVFFYHGSADVTVPLRQVVAYKTLLEQAQVPCELFVLKGRTHINAFMFDNAAIDAALKFLDHYLRP